MTPDLDALARAALAVLAVTPQDIRHLPYMARLTDFRDAAPPSVVLALVREVRELRQRVRDLASGEDPIGDAKDAAALKSASGERISVFAASADPTTRTFKRPT
jgi:hypothetical protein